MVSLVAHRCVCCISLWQFLLFCSVQHRLLVTNVCFWELSQCGRAKFVKFCLACVRSDYMKCISTNRSINQSITYDRCLPFVDKKRHT